MIKKDNFLYDENFDRLMISNHLHGDEKIEGSVRITNLIIDLTNKNKIVNLEIQGVSEYLESLGKSSEILGNLKDAKMRVLQVGENFLIQILLYGMNKTEKLDYSIQTSGKWKITI